MCTIYGTCAEELGQRFLDTLKHQFQGCEIEIAVCDAAAKTGDEAACPLGSLADRERMLKAMDNVAQVRNLVDINPRRFLMKIVLERF